MEAREEGDSYKETCVYCAHQVAMVRNDIALQLNFLKSKAKVEGLQVHSLLYIPSFVFEG